MLKVGITGGIGSGKSTVCAVFKVIGIPVFSSDDQAKLILDADGQVHGELLALFGKEVFRQGKPDRAALGRLVFNDREALDRLNAILHPAVRKAFRAWAELQDAAYVINEAAILVETEAYKELDRLVVVTAPEKVRIARVIRRDGVTDQQVRERMRNQTSDETRAAVANHIIVNDGTAMIIPQVLAVHAALLTRTAQL